MDTNKDIENGVKTCSKCGWVLAIQHPLTHCPICRTPFNVGICSVCKKPIEYYRRGRRVCKRCYDTVWRTPRDHMTMMNRREEFYAEWIENISKIPKSYPTLTEEQWLAAVKHFNGCALCKSETVDTRGYFIPFNKGGRYCDWNIIPICDKCATEYRKNPNYFKRNRPDGLMDIVDYLEEKINGAIEKSSGSTE